MQVTLKGKRVVKRTINAASAALAVGEITRGMDVYGLSKGQFSLVELIEHCLGATGPADVVISTWTAAGADLGHVRTLLDNGNVRSCRWLVDFSFPRRQPGYTKILRERFGDDSIRCTANHAKFVLIRNDDWNIVLRTSMNLNLNRRLESYEISDDAELASWLGEIVEACFGGDAASIFDANSAPHAAKVTVNTIGGAVDAREPNLEYRSDGRGISFD